MSNYGADINPDLDRIRQVAFAFGLAPLDDLKVDQFSTPTSLKVFHFVQKIGSNNLSVLVDPAQLPHS